MVTTCLRLLATISVSFAYVYVYVCCMLHAFAYVYVYVCCMLYAVCCMLLYHRNTGVTAYLDETGVLKGLPINTRASSIASLCGFEGVQLRGDVFVGRHEGRR